MITKKDLLEALDKMEADYPKAYASVTDMYRRFCEYLPDEPDAKPECEHYWDEMKGFPAVLGQEVCVKYGDIRAKKPEVAEWETNFAAKFLNINSRELMRPCFINEVKDFIKQQLKEMGEEIKNRYSSMFNQEEYLKHIVDEALRKRGCL